MRNFRVLIASSCRACTRRFTLAAALPRGTGLAGTCQSTQSRSLSSNKYFNLPLGKVAAPDEGIRLDRWILQQFVVPEQLVRKWIRQKKFRLIFQGNNLIEDVHATGTTRLAAGTVVVSDKEVTTTLAVSPTVPVQNGFTGPPTVGFSSDAAASALALQLSRCVLYADDDLVAVRKPAGIPVQGGTGINVSVASSLPALAALLTQAGDSELQALRLVHRLDRDVSGILLLARNRNAAARLCAAFRAGGEDDGTAETGTSTSLEETPRAPFKQYVGMVASALPANTPKSGSITSPVIHEEWQSGREKGSKPALRERTELPASTAYSVTYSTDALSLVLLWPSTGRKHQLRQHVSHLFGGVGLVGDSKYGRPSSEPVLRSGGSEKGIALHLACLRLPAGVLGSHHRRDIILMDPLPPRMREAIIASQVPASALSGIGLYAIGDSLSIADKTPAIKQGE